MNYRHSLIASLCVLLSSAACGPSEETLPPLAAVATVDLADTGDIATEDVEDRDTDDTGDADATGPDVEPDADTDTAETGDTDDADVAPDVPPTPIETFDWASHEVFIYVSDDSSSPLVGATVFLDTRTAITDGSGNVWFRDVDTPAHTLSPSTRLGSSMDSGTSRSHTSARWKSRSRTWSNGATSRP